MLFVEFFNAPSGSSGIIEVETAWMKPFVIAEAEEEQERVPLLMCLIEETGQIGAPFNVLSSLTVTNKNFPTRHKI